MKPQLPDVIEQDATLLQIVSSWFDEIQEIQAVSAQRLEELFLKVGESWLAGSSACTYGSLDTIFASQVFRGIPLETIIVAFYTSWLRLNEKHPHEALRAHGTLAYMESAMLRAQ